MKAKFPIAKQHIIVPIIVFITALLAFVFDHQLSDLLVYNRQAIAESQFWRLFTGHFFHTNDMHFLLNSAALVLLWALHGHHYSVKNQVFLYVFAALTTSVGIWFSSPELNQYVGLSGILHGVFVWGALQDIKSGDKLGWLLVIGAFAKVIYEQVYGASSDIVNLIDASVAVDAHLWGAIAGLLVALAGQRIKSQAQ
ncbi:rhombosortase [Endozoicomonas sp. G2_1]|uniref:rhombosortase n=1 Tax=Endozoicomonas sp. G2_1 TaxID=2821091 RepID=UPI001AD9EC02|nr:rhombosortase [Endozoicomonas sp. G2_1]MBO9490840.1 rhombosortase [Endozoicomonas sp. G2_1]